MKSLRQAHVNNHRKKKKQSALLWIIYFSSFSPTKLYEGFNPQQHTKKTPLFDPFNIEYNSLTFVLIIINLRPYI